MAPPKRSPQPSFWPGALGAMGAPSAWISLVGLRPCRSRLRFSRQGKGIQSESDFQGPGDTRVMPRKSLGVRGAGPPKSPSVSEGGGEFLFRRCNHLKRYMILFNHGSTSPTNSREEPNFCFVAFASSSSCLPCKLQRPLLDLACHWFGKGINHSRG